MGTPSASQTRSMTRSRTRSAAPLSRSYLGSDSRSCHTKTMLKAYQTRSRSVAPSQSARTVAVEDLSYNKLFKVANKANEKGIEALKKQMEPQIALLTARAENAEARADRENKRYPQPSAHLCEALVRAKVAEARVENLGNTHVRDVLKFILKNSNTSGQTMNAVRPN